MNKDYLFLKNLYTLLEAGYSTEEALHLCQHIFSHSDIESILVQLRAGVSLEDCLLEFNFPATFKEYFGFFKNKNCLSEAIEKSVNICISQQQYQTKLKSQLTYPSILLMFLLLFSIFVVFILIPQVNALFDSFQIEKSLLFQFIFMLFYLIPLILIICTFLIVYMISQLIYALHHKKFLIIERYLKLPIFKTLLQKYFSLKLAIYYQELLYENMDSVSIIQLLNEQLSRTDLKIVLYEISNRLFEGESLEDIIADFDYLDSLFLSFFRMYMKNPTMKDSLSYYIQLTYDQIEMWKSEFLKYLIPSIYGFVAVFVITIYVSIIIPMMNIISDV